MKDEINVHFFVNGQEIRTQAPHDISLMQFLREWLNYTGTKNGCASGHCGACTVIMGGNATRSCLVKMSKVNDTKVETIEGLAKDGKLHPIQQMFIEHGAVQCGYCTPGMIMSAKALLDINPRPTEEEIKEALTKGPNLCRCTGYVNIIKAIQAAGEVMAGEKKLEPLLEGDRVQSTQLYRDAIDKVSGTTKYGADIKMERMLFGKILWAEHPHAEIVSIDTSGAEAVEGVVRVITAKDIHGKNITGYLNDKPAIASEKVRYIGDSLACVFAESEEIAANAVEKIRVEYNVLPGVFTPDEAAKPNAPKIHEKGNLRYHALIERGDIEKAFKQCEVIIERDYKTPFTEHGFMEPESGISFLAEDGGVTLLLPNVSVFFVREQLVEILNMPEDKIRVIQIPQGGAFGGKEDPIFEVYLALGALLTNRPVRIVLTREESLRVHVKRHPAWMHYKTGADKDGRVLAVDLQVTADTGAYISFGTAVLKNMVGFGAGPYYVPNLRLEGNLWYTNNVPCGSMRGFGVNQVAFGLEQNMDDMARALNIDPFKFRLINALEPGMPTATDHVLEKGIVSIKETIEGARQAFKKLDIPKTTGNKRIGIGVASAVKNVGFGHTATESAGAIIELDTGGNVILRVSHHEEGQGGQAGQQQLAANELGVPVNRIKIIGPDTNLTPPTGATTASRQTMLTGNATVMVCRALKESLFGHAAEVMNVSPEMLKLSGNQVINPESGECVNLSDLGEKFMFERVYTAPKTATLLEGEVSQYGKPGFESRMTHWAYIFTTQVAVVEVDMDTGEVKVLKVVSAHDVGKAINPKVIEGQVHGGVVWGIGYALMEEFVIEKGINKTDTLHKYRMPTANHVPEIIPVIIEVAHPFGPQGAKGFAEGSSLAICPAIMNAIYDAIGEGERITTLPANKERVLKAIRARQG